MCLVQDVVGDQVLVGDLDQLLDYQVQVFCFGGLDYGEVECVVGEVCQVFVVLGELDKEGM